MFPELISIFSWLKQKRDTVFIYPVALFFKRQLVPFTSAGVDMAMDRKQSQALSALFSREGIFNVSDRVEIQTQVECDELAQLALLKELHPGFCGCAEDVCSHAGDESSQAF